MSIFTLEWVRVAPELVVVAASDRAWLHSVPAFLTSDPFAQPMRGAGSPATTRNLLDGVICAAQRAVAKARHRPPLTVARWVWRLAGFYHTTHATPRLMAEAAARFMAAGRHELAAYAAGKARDERGHDALALKDLSTLGYPAEMVVESLVPPTASDLTDYFARSVRADDPVSCVGYSYALERLAVTAGKDYIKQVEAILPRGVRATRCLRVHSGMGTDLRHVEEAVEVTARLSPAERMRVARACYDTAKICCAPPRGGHLSEKSLTRYLSTFTQNPTTKGVRHV